VNRARWETGLGGGPLIGTSTGRALPSGRSLVAWSGAVDFYRTWVTDPVLAQKQVEKITRPTIGAEATRVSGIPRPRQ